MPEHCRWCGNELPPGDVSYCDLHTEVVGLRSKLSSGVLVTGVKLHNIGNVEIVSVEVDGQWVELIRESGSGIHSHICEPAGIRARINGTATVKP